MKTDFSQVNLDSAKDVLSWVSEADSVEEALLPFHPSLPGSIDRCGRFFFPEDFTVPSHAITKRIDQILESSARKKVIAAPRGVGKTTRVLLGKIAPRILFRTVKFVVYITNTADNAVMHTENLKRALLTSDLVRELFGSIKINEGIEGVTGLEDLNDSFSKRAWVAFGDILVLPRGAGQQVRGIKFGPHRPDLIVFDDLEDSEHIESDLQREKLSKWFYGDVMKCVSRYDKGYEYNYIDTLKHQQALLKYLLDSEDWMSARLQACDDDLNPTAPEYMSKAELEKEYEEHRRQGQEDTFYREFRNIAISTKDAVFKREYFQYYFQNQGLYIPENLRDKPDQIEAFSSRSDDIIRVIIVDPAKTVNPRSAESAIVGIGVDRRTERIFIEDIVADRFHPDELILETIDMTRRLNAWILAVEVTSLSLFVSQPIENAIQNAKPRLNCIYHELNARGKKEDRVKGLASYYRQGQIFHNPAVCRQLEDQLKFFPRPHRWDVMDATAYIIQVMEELDIWFESDDSSDYSSMEEEDFYDPEPEESPENLILYV